MAQINSIRALFFEKGLSYAEISRTTGHDVKTIKKYIQMENFNLPQPEPPVARVSKLEPYRATIDEWLIADKAEWKKQRHTAKRVHSRLVKKFPDFDCSYRLVASYVSAKKKQIYSNQGDFFMPLVHKPGAAQADFGVAYFHRKTQRIKGRSLNMSTPYSNGGYSQLFRGESFECFAEGLTNIFYHIGGVPRELWLDNFSAAVKAIRKDNSRDLTDSFMRFKNHYGLKVVFMNLRKGNEKGNVENKVGYNRRNLLVPPPEVEDVLKFNEQLLVECDEDMLRPHYKKELFHRELFEEDRKAFLPLPSSRFDASTIVAARTDAYAKFTLNDGKHTYSTAPRFAKTQVLARLTAHEVIVLDENYREVVRHERLYGGNRQEQMDWLPYLGQLARRPRALKYTGVYSMLPGEIQHFLDKNPIQVTKETLRVLAHLTERSSFAQATDAMRTALLHGAEDADSIITAFNRLNGDVVDLDPMALPPSVPKMPQVKPDLNAYDRAFLEGADRDEV